jgi:uncharacterized membrane protein
MIVYHLMWDLWYFGVFPDIDLWSGSWKYLQRFTASTFILLVGLSSTLAYRHERERRRPQAHLFPKFCRRGLKIFGIGLLISLSVWAAGIGYVDFGVLHLIGFSIIAAYPFLRFKWLNLGLWAVVFIAGGLVQHLPFNGLWLTPQLGGWSGAPLWIDSRWLAPLGITSARYAAVDFFPVLPWFGVVLLGIWFGNWFYTGNQRLIKLPDWGGAIPFTTLQFLGRHSLVIYVIHQPVLLLGLALSGVIRR